MSRILAVILSAAKDLFVRLARSFAALRMTGLISKCLKTLGIHYNTAYRLFKCGQIAGYQLPIGTVIVEESVDHTEHRALRPHYGRRRAKGKTAQVLAALQQNGEDA